MTRVAIAGSRGRMGRALLSAVSRFPEIQVAAQMNRGDDARELIARAEVLIDFSAPEATERYVDLCAELGKPIVIGTTGLEPRLHAKIEELSRRLPIVLASNFSTGVNTLFWLAQCAAQILGDDFDIEIVEMHHRLKKDAPSGTAATLAQLLAAARSLKTENAVKHGRAGNVGARTKQEIGVHALRGGDVVGDHTVIFAANGERLELTHKASSRETFAAGALRAALWLVQHPPGLYDMRDVLQLKKQI